MSSWRRRGRRWTTCCSFRASAGGGRRHGMYLRWLLEENGLERPARRRWVGARHRVASGECAVAERARRATRSSVRTRGGDDEGGSLGAASLERLRPARRARRRVAKGGVTSLVRTAGDATAVRAWRGTTGTRAARALKVVTSPRKPSDRVRRADARGKGEMRLCPASRFRRSRLRLYRRDRRRASRNGPRRHARRVRGGCS